MTQFRIHEITPQNFKGNPKYNFSENLLAKVIADLLTPPVKGKIRLMMSLDEIIEELSETNPHFNREEIRLDKMPARYNMITRAIYTTASHSN